MAAERWSCLLLNSRFSVEFGALWEGQGDQMGPQGGSGRQTGMKEPSDSRAQNLGTCPSEH